MVLLLFLAETEMVQILVAKCVVLFVENHNVGGVGNGDSWEGKKHVVADALSRKAVLVATMMIQEWKLIEDFRDFNLSKDILCANYGVVQGEEFKRCS